LLFLVSALALAAQTRTGLQPVGFAAFSAADVNRTIDVFTSCPANQTCELAALAYSFGNFDNFRKFIEGTMPALKNKQKLVFTMYLDDGANRDNRPDWCRFRRGVDTKAFWAAVRSKDQTLKRDWEQEMAKPAGDFIRSMQAWAKQRSFSQRLSFTVVPVLEDGIPNANDLAGSAGYKTLLSWTKSKMPAGVKYRRSSTAKNPSRVVTTLEWHDTRVPAAFRANDVITPDGKTVSDGSWKEQQVYAITKKRGSGLWWIPQFNNNGGERTQRPWERGALTPFTADPSLVGRAKAMLQARK
jgi:hypothetical protein